MAVRCPFRAALAANSKAVLPSMTVMSKHCPHMQAEGGQGVGSFTSRLGGAIKPIPAPTTSEEARSRALATPAGEP
jgi:hypothetical protein